MLAAIGDMPALVFAAQWLVSCLLAAAISWVVLVFFLWRRLGVRHAEGARHAPLQEIHRGPLFAALFLVAFAAANLYIEGRAFGLYAPLLAAPAPVLFLLLYYVYPDTRYAGRAVRWLAVLYAFAQLAAFIPQQPQATNPHAEVILKIPGVLGTLLVLGDTLALGPIVIGILPQLYSRARRLAESGRQQSGSQRVGIAVILAGAIATFALLFVAGLLAPPALLDPTTAAAASSAVTAAPPALQAARLAFFLLTSLAPVGVGFVLMSGRHYDREALLHRALVYLALVACLLLVYAVGIVALDLVLPGYSGFGEYLPFILPIGVLLAAIYPLLRAQIEAQIGRRFFHESYEAGLALGVASAALRAETRPDQLCAQLVTAVEKALRPARVALWVRPAPGAASLRAAGIFAPPLLSPPTPPASAEHPPGGTTAPPPPNADVTFLRRYARSSGSASARAALLTVRDDDPARTAFQWPVSVIEVDALPRESPAATTLRAAGMRLALPLVNQGDLEAVLALAPRQGARPYGSDTRELLVALADGAAPALHAARIAQRQDVEVRERERVEQELQTARRIQESLLPKAVPALIGWQIATTYQPAREVGGDFYDFIALAGGQLGIVLGDVTDKGIPAALVMATTRSMLRAVATQPDAAPDSVLAQVNELLCPDLPASMFVTCFYAILDPTSGRLRFANAGQDLPYRRHPDGAVNELRATGMPLGLLPGATYDAHETTLAPGDSLLFFSDGVVEAHNPAREMFGLPRVERLLGAYDGDSPPIITLLHALADFTGPDWEQEDDITLVALRRASAQEASADENDGAEGWRALADFTLPSVPGGEREAITRVSAAVASLGLAPQRLADLQTAVGEATMNAMEHGNHYQAELPVAIEVRASADALSVRLTDQGAHTHIAPLPEAGQAPDLAAKLAEEQSPRGWGLFLMRSLVDEVVVSGDATQHTVELVLALDIAPPESQDDS